jgi:hypothetical protein
LARALLEATMTEYRGYRLNVIEEDASPLQLSTCAEAARRKIKVLEQV